MWPAVSDALSISTVAHCDRHTFFSSIAAKIKGCCVWLFSHWLIWANEANEYFPLTCAFFFFHFFSNGSTDIDDVGGNKAVPVMWPQHWHRKVALAPSCRRTDSAANSVHATHGYISFRIDQYVAGREAPYLFFPLSILIKQAWWTVWSFSGVTDSSAAPPGTRSHSWLSPRCLVGGHGGVELRWPSYPSGANAQSQYDCWLSVFVDVFLCRGNITRINSVFAAATHVDGADKRWRQREQKRVSVVFMMFVVGQRLHDSVACHRVRVSYLLSVLYEETAKTKRTLPLVKNVHILTCMTTNTGRGKKYTNK